MGAVLVTGGFGYIGRRIVAELATAGQPAVSYNRDYHGPSDPELAYVHGELFDTPRLVRAIVEHDVTSVIHTAGMSHPDLSLDFPLTTFAANFDGTAHLLEAMRMTPARRIVNFSSECAYGNRPESPLTEDAPLQPTTPYGVTKAATEMLMRVYRDRYGFDPVSLRITEVYGPGNRVPQILCDMLDAVVADRPWETARGSDHRFQFVHVDDVAHAAVLAASRSTLPQLAYNVSGDRFLDVAELISVITRLYPEARLSAGPGRLDGDVLGPFDITAARRDLGYAPRWRLEDGIRHYVEEARAPLADG
jgi:UDP-glucose 4-epimerase